MCLEDLSCSADLHKELCVILVAAGTVVSVVSAAFASIRASVLIFECCSLEPLVLGRGLERLRGTFAGEQVAPQCRRLIFMR